MENQNKINLDDKNGEEETLIYSKTTGTLLRFVRNSNGNIVVKSHDVEVEVVANSSEGQTLDVSSHSLVTASEISEEASELEG